MIKLIDDQVGRLLDHLEKTGQAENTLVIFMSDHGELLGDHGLLYKGCRFLEGLVHVPLICSWAAGAAKGVQSRALVELVDLAPTLLGAAGLEAPYYMQGQSLLPIITGQGDPSRHKPHVICEYHGAMGSDLMADQSHGFMYYDGRHKAAVYQGHEIGELYDLREDPGEFDNLWDRPACRELKAEMVRRAFDAYLATSSAGVRRIGSY